MTSPLRSLEARSLMNAYLFWGVGVGEGVGVEWRGEGVEGREEGCHVGG